MTTFTETFPITEYALPEDPVEAALAYPGKRPNGSFMALGQELAELPNNFTDFQAAADEYLAAQGLPLIAERIPVLAYGSNANPGKLEEKMAKFYPDAQPAMQVVPHCAVLLPDTLAVWHGQPGQTGSYFAELYTGPEAKGATLQTHVAFLTLEQMGALDTTEGVTYTKIEMPAKIGLGEDDKITNVIAYTAFNSQILLDEAGQPVLVDSLDHRGTDLNSLTAREAVRYTLENVAQETGLTVDEREFVRDGQAMKLADKKARQARVLEVMRAHGISRPYNSLDEGAEKAIPRLDFASLPGQDHHLHRLPQMVWTDKEMIRLNTGRAQSELLKTHNLTVKED